VAALAAIALPFVAVDRYRRVDLQGSRDGPLVLAVCREGARTAERLAAGDEVVFDPETRRFAWGETDAAQLGRMRWFLREGWGERAHYGTGEVVMHAPAASVLLPVFVPADLQVRLRMMSPAPATPPLAATRKPPGAW